MAESDWVPIGHRAVAGMDRMQRGWLALPQEQAVRVETDNWPAVAIAGSPLKPFELYDDITPGSTGVYAWPLLPDLTRDTSADKILVADKWIGDSRAYGSNHWGSSGSTGAKGVAAIDEEGTYQVVRLKNLSRQLTGTCYGSVAKTDSTFDVDNVTVLDDLQSPVESASDVLAVSNWAKWEANDNQAVDFCRNSTGWRFVQGGCKADFTT